MQRLSDTDCRPLGTRVATIGMFDGVHRGHATLIAALRERALHEGRRSLVITFDRHPQQVLNPSSGVRLLQTLDDRLSCLEELSPDELLLLNFTPALAATGSREFMQLLHDRYGVATLVVGYNHRFGHDQPLPLSEYAALGGEVGVTVVNAPEYLGEYAPVSSTIVRGLIAAGKVADALHCMGRPYRLAGRVVHGFHNGRGIGFPTANVGGIDPALVLPHNGAYAVMVHLDGHELQGMVNVGTRPTLDNGTQLSIEVNIFDFDGDIYGHPIALDFIGFLRLEFKLGSVDELRQQLTRDRDKSREILKQWTMNNV
ncbi:MAG: riboflavin biosynthesis protein RibF [Muribaculaceae bacterium]|nr:riboflavin biosynthesis protein RibF [Muribaculaceae bacterium]